MENLEILEGSVVLPAEQSEPVVSGSSDNSPDQDLRLERKVAEQIINDEDVVALLEKEANALLAEKKAGHLTTLRKKMLENDLHRIRLRQQELIANLRRGRSLLVDSGSAKIRQRISEKQENLEKIREDLKLYPDDMTLKHIASLAEEDLRKLGDAASRNSFMKKDFDDLRKT